MKGFKKLRKLKIEYVNELIKIDAEHGSILAKNLQGAMPAIALDGHPGLSTAYMNDCEPLLCFAQQVNGYGKLVLVVIVAISFLLQLSRVQKV